MPDEAIGTRANINHCIALYRVADKYDFPHLHLTTRRISQTELRLWLDGAPQTVTENEPSASSKDFRELVSSIYELPNAALEHPLVAIIMRMTRSCESVKIFDTAGRASTFLADAAKEVPEFGRDLFFHMSKEVKIDEGESREGRRTTELGILVKVKCFSCGKIWSRSCDSPLEGHCLECGSYVEYWETHEWH